MNCRDRHESKLGSVGGRIGWADEDLGIDCLESVVVERDARIQD